LILRWAGESVVPGGGANAVANVAALGGAPVPFGVVGEDESGRELLRLFAERGIETGGILARPGYRTPTKTRILAGGRHAIKQQLVRYDIEDEWLPSEAELAELESRVEHLASDAGAVVFSDYGYGAVRPSILQRLRPRFADAPILGDSRYRLDAFEGFDGATPNLEEAENLMGGPLADGPELADEGRRLLERLGMQFLLVTRGSSGMSLFEAPGVRSGGVAHLPVHGTDQVADVTGAGDTVIGTFALALAGGATPLEACCLANYAGGIVVTKMGTATLDRDELREAVRSDPDLLGQIAISTPPAA
jgi:rfaE bifunctional protein kinase chain/domain